MRDDETKELQKIQNNEQNGNIKSTLTNNTLNMKGLNSPTKHFEWLNG